MDTTETQFFDVDTWISTGPDEEELVEYVNTLEDEVQLLERNLQEKRGKIARTRQLIELRRHWFRTEAGTAVAIAEITPDGTVVGEIPRGRSAVRLLLRDFPGDHEWSAPEILAALIRRGWATERDHHSVQVSLSRMFREGELERPARGRYRLPMDYDNEK